MKRMMKCPACGFTQEDSAVECPRCGIVFAKFYARTTAQVEPPPPPQEEDSDAGWSFRPILRAASWLTLAGSVMLTFLILRPAPPLVVRMTPEAERMAEVKISQFERFVRAGKARTLSLSETELNSWLHSSLDFGQSVSPDDSPATTTQVSSAGLQPDSKPSDPGQPGQEGVRAAVTDLRVGLENDHVRTYVRFQLYGKDMSFELEGTVGAADGYLRLEPTAGRLGSCPLPTSTLNAAVSRLLQSPENREKLRLPDYVSNLAVANGELQVEFAGR